MPEIFSIPFVSSLVLSLFKSVHALILVDPVKEYQRVFANGTQKFPLFGK